MTGDLGPVICGKGKIYYPQQPVPGQTATKADLAAILGDGQHFRFSPAFTQGNLSNNNNLATYSSSKFSHASILQDVDADEDLDHAAARYFLHCPDDLIPKTEEDLAVLKHFKHNIKVVGGRYEVALPWRPEAEFLESNFAQALARLKQMLTQLSLQTAVLERYHKQKMDLLEADIIEMVPELEKAEGIISYLPHRGVYRADKDKL